MSANFACVIPARWSMEDYARHTCHDRSHFHFSRNDFAQHVTDGAVEVVRESNRHLRLPAVVRIVRVPRVGISRRYGALIARMLTDDRTRIVAQTMLLEIRRRREIESARVGGAISPKSRSPRTVATHAHVSAK